MDLIQVAKQFGMGALHLVELGAALDRVPPRVPARDTLGGTSPHKEIYMPRKPFKPLSAKDRAYKAMIEIQRSLSASIARRRLLAAIRSDSCKKIQTVYIEREIPTMLQNWMRRRDEERAAKAAVSEHDRRLAAAAMERQHRRMGHHAERR